MELTDEQNAALNQMRRFLSDRDAHMGCFEGPAGSGKTTVVGELLKDVSLPNLCMAAPSHKALRVLREKCGNPSLQFRTLSSLLGEEPWEDENGKLHFASGSIKAGAGEMTVIVDECSMVKREHFEKLHAFKKVLFVGDSAQVPPINERLSPTFTVPDKFALTSIVRQAADNPIIGLSKMIRDVVQPTYFTLRDALTVDRRYTLCTRSDLHNFAADAHKRGMRTVILAHKNTVVDAHNAAMHARLYPNDALFGVGEPVVSGTTIWRNDGIVIHNSETAIVVSCVLNKTDYGMDFYDVALKCDDGGVVKLRYADQRLITLARNQFTALYQQLTSKRLLILNTRHDKDVDRDLASVDVELRVLDRMKASLRGFCDLKHAYAITVYKAQGSTYDVALIDWSDLQPSRWRDRRLLYTAITRPKDYLVVAV